jgi:hypothetical protein
MFSSFFVVSKRKNVKRKDINLSKKVNDYGKRKETNGRHQGVSP